ncbi:MAG: hypothetical protein JNK10_14590 [Cyclobacteriaceae bacterium]|nr:hypothetical protein [Cyclobacteriaceae bacterium]MBL7866105.1 hypothetical protein [Cyclobacteriaceae bacterium]
MNSRYWQIIRDDGKKTFAVHGQESNTNSFTNLVHGMQKAGMNVTCMTPPVTNRNPSKDSIKLTGYIKEEGLYERLMKEYNRITRSEFE